MGYGLLTALMASGCLSTPSRPTTTAPDAQAQLGPAYRQHFIARCDSQSMCTVPTPNFTAGTLLLAVVAFDSTAGSVKSMAANSGEKFQPLQTVDWAKGLYRSELWWAWSVAAPSISVTLPAAPPNYKVYLAEFAATSIASLPPYSGNIAGAGPFTAGYVAIDTTPTLVFAHGDGAGSGLIVGTSFIEAYEDDGSRAQYRVIEPPTPSEPLPVPFVALGPADWMAFVVKLQ